MEGGQERNSGRTHPPVLEIDGHFSQSDFCVKEIRKVSPFFIPFSRGLGLSREIPKLSPESTVDKIPYCSVTCKTSDEKGH